MKAKELKAQAEQTQWQRHRYYSISVCLAACADHYKVKATELLSCRRHRYLQQARKHFAWLLYCMRWDTSYPSVARALHRDHHTIHRAVRIFQENSTNNQQDIEAVESIIRKLNDKILQADRTLGGNGTSVGKLGVATDQRVQAEPR